MTETLQIPLPDYAQITIYVGTTPPPPYRIAEPIDAASPPGRWRPVRTGLLGVLLIGLGYFAHGLVAEQAAAEADRPTPAMLHVLPLPPRVSSGATLGEGVTAPNIRVTPPRAFGSQGAAAPPAALSESPPPSFANTAPPGAPAAISRSPFGLN